EQLYLHPALCSQPSAAPEHALLRQLLLTAASHCTPHELCS
ncbi:hypothetical protein Anapl_03840, partial [Anas platyrhynchos]